MATTSHPASADGAQEGAAAAASTREAAPVSTRERILEIALALFTEQGYDKTSIRDIAEQLGVTKAALYYHFKSKADILLELHLRLHHLGERLLDALEALPDGEARARVWPELLDEFITDLDGHRDLLAFHQRNQSALEALHDSERHHAANDDIERQVRRLLASSALPPAVRVRMACSIGAVMTGLLMDGLVEDIPHEEKIRLVRATVADMFRAG